MRITVWHAVRRLGLSPVAEPWRKGTSGRVLVYRSQRRLRGIDGCIVLRRKGVDRLPIFLSGLAGICGVENLW